MTHPVSETKRKRKFSVDVERDPNKPKADYDNMTKKTRVEGPVRWPIRGSDADISPSSKHPFAFVDDTTRDVVMEDQTQTALVDAGLGTVADVLTRGPNKDLLSVLNIAEWDEESTYSNSTVTPSRHRWEMNNRGADDATRYQAHVSTVSEVKDEWAAVYARKREIRSADSSDDADSQYSGRDRSPSRARSVQSEASLFGLSGDLGAFGLQDNGVEGLEHVGGRFEDISGDLESIESANDAAGEVPSGVVSESLEAISRLEQAETSGWVD